MGDNASGLHAAVPESTAPLLKKAAPLPRSPLAAKENLPEPSARSPDEKLLKKAPSARSSGENLFVRKCERYTLSEATEPFEIDVENLRKCEPPYEGNSAKDLLNYLEENIWDHGCDGEFVESEHNKEVYGEDELYRLTMEEEDCPEVFFDSREKCCDDWYEIGVPNEKYRKVGRFESRADTARD